MPVSASALSSEGELLSIGQVLSLLQTDFNDLTPSKLRFLEEQGLLTPDRTKSGYRKFSQFHIDRLRLILTLQRDHYLPLKVIADVLTDMDNGVEPTLPAGAAPQANSIFKPRALLNRKELLKETGASPQLLAGAIAAGLVPPVDIFPREVVAIVEALIVLAKKGITPRHLRALRVAAEKDAQLLKQAASNGHKPSSKHSVQDGALELADCLDTVRAGLLRQLLSQG